MTLSKSDLQALARELSYRGDMDDAFESWSLHTSPADLENAEHALDCWTKRLMTPHLGFSGCAALASVQETEPEGYGRLTGERGEFRMLWSALPPDVHERVWRTVRERASLTVKTNIRSEDRQSKYGLLIVAPCVKTTPPTCLAAFYNGDNADYLARVCVQRAANLASRDLFIILNQDERIRGYRQMAGKMAQMCSGSVSLAQLRLHRLRRQMKEKECLGQDLDQELQGILGDLNEAQEAMDRARLMGSQPWERFKETFNVGTFVEEIGRKLNDAVAGDGPPVVAPTSLEKCQQTQLSLTASPMRMRYAIRDILLGAWVLGNKQRPLEVSLVNGSVNSLTLRGGAYRPATAGVGVISDLDGSELLRMLRDPEVFLKTASSTESAERSLGLQNAFDMLDEINARVEVHNDEKDLELVITLPRPETPHESQAD